MSKSGESNINRHVNVVGGLTGLSRILGLVREMLTARLLGSSLEQSAFVFAFQIPNLFRRLFGEGALSAAFIPVFKRDIENGRRKEAELLASRVAGMLAVILGGIVVGGIALITLTMPFFKDHERIPTIFQLLRIMLPYAFFICLAALGMGILNSMGKFAGAAFAPSLLNVIWIVTLILLMMFSGLSMFTKVMIISIAVLLAGVAQFLFLMVAVRRLGVCLKFSFFGWKEESVRRVWRNTIPAAIGAGVIQINLVIDNALAFWAAPWGPAAISYAERVTYLPLGVVATAFATVLLPTLSGAFARNDLESARNTILRSAEGILLVMTPAFLGLLLLSKDIVCVIYQGGAFSGDDTIFVTRALACYAPGLIAFSLNKIMTPWFYAQGDTRTPLYVGVCMIFANVIMNVVLIITLPHGWKHAGIAFSTVVCSIITCIVLNRIISKRNGNIGWRLLTPVVLRIAFTSAIMCIAMFLVRYALTSCFDGGKTFQECNIITRITTLTLSVGTALLVYGIIIRKLCPVEFRRILAKK